MATSRSARTTGPAAYEPFGATRTETGGGGNQPANYVRFTGEYLDPTGLYHLRARQYTPATARFTSVDPIPEYGRGESDSSYGYVSNRPTVLVDPSGATGVPSDGRHVQLAVTPAAANVCGPQTLGAFAARRNYRFSFPWFSGNQAPSLHAFRAAMWTKLTRLPAHECRWRVRYGAIYDSLTLSRFIARIHFGFVFAITSRGGRVRLWAPDDGDVLTVSKPQKWPSEITGSDELTVPHGSRPTSVHFVVSMNKPQGNTPSSPIARRLECPLVLAGATTTAPGAPGPGVC